LQSLYQRVATALTVYGIETRDEMTRAKSQCHERRCNSAYRLRY